MASLSSSSSSLPSLAGKPVFPVNLPVRYIVLALVLLATSIEYVCRYNINVSMVAMVRPANKSAEEYIESGCPLPGGSLNGTVVHGGGTYDWDAATQGVILGGEQNRDRNHVRQIELKFFPLQPSFTATR